MKRWLFFIYRIACHATFLTTNAYMAGFVGNLFVAKSIDVPGGGYMAEAVAINLCRSRRLILVSPSPDWAVMTFHWHTELVAHEH